MNPTQANAVDLNSAALVRAGGVFEALKLKGTFRCQCFDKDGNLKWEDTIENVVTYVGKNLALDTYLAAASYAVVGPYMGLISSDSYTGVPVIGDTMASHGTWKEAGATYTPHYTAPRKTCAWSAANNGSKALSAALAFVFTGSGTVKGCFLVYGAGAVSTIDSTAGVLYSAGLFTGGDKAVVDTDTLNVSYTASL